MTDFPDRIKVRVLDADASTPVPNIAVFIHLYAQRKNDYYFLLPISTKDGAIDVSKDWLRKEIASTAGLFIMDYASALEDCQPRFELEILSEDDVKRAIKAMILFKEALSTSQEQIDALAKVDNQKYLPVSELLQLHGEKVMEIEIRIHKARGE